jgi:hypothetical protein
MAIGITLLEGFGVDPKCYEPLPLVLQALCHWYQERGPILWHLALAPRLLADLPVREGALVRLQGLPLRPRQLWSRCRCHMRYRLYCCLYNRRGGLSCPPLLLVGREALPAQGDRILNCQQ